MPLTNILFWTFAFLILFAAIGSGVWGIRCARLQRLESHRFWMKTAGWLIAGFLLAYIAKLSWLGREDLETWSTWRLATLRLHETAMLFMLVSGSIALYMSRLLSRRLAVGEVLPPAKALVHRRAGKTALISGACGLVTGSAVLASMYTQLLQ